MGRIEGGGETRMWESKGAGRGKRSERARRDEVGRVLESECSKETSEDRSSDGELTSSAGGSRGGRGSSGVASSSTCGGCAGRLRAR